MKIGYIAHRVHYEGGMERAAAEVLTRLAERHEVVVLARECAVQAPTLTFVPLRPLPRPNTLMGWSFGRLARQAETQFGLTLTHSVGAAAIEADIITAQFCHAAFHHRLGGLRGGSHPLQQWYQNQAEQIFIQQERRAYTSPRLKAVIAVSEGIKRELIRYYGVCEHMIQVIPNAVDAAVFRPAVSEAERVSLRRTLRLPEAGFLCLFVGGDWERKGLADAIQAVAGQPQTFLVVVGAGDTEKFRALAQRYGAAKQVLFAGRIRKPQEYYRAADLFVFPSRYEAFSLVTLEAAASGLPVIARRINGTEELIEDGVNGFFVDAGPTAIREKIRDLREDPDRLLQMSIAARESALCYTWDRVAAMQIALMEAVGEQQS